MPRFIFIIIIIFFLYLLTCSEKKYEKFCCNDSLTHKNTNGNSNSVKTIS